MRSVLRPFSAISVARFLSRHRLAFGGERRDDAEDACGATRLNRFRRQRRRAQGLGEFREWRIEDVAQQGRRDHVRRRAGLTRVAAGPARLVDPRHTEAFEAELVTDLLRRPESAVAILAEGADGAAGERAEHHGERERERRVRRARLQRHRGGRDDAGVGHREGLLLDRLLIALEERLVEALVVVGFAFELAQGDELVVRLRGDVDLFLQRALQAFVARLGDLPVAPIGLGRAVELLEHQALILAHLAAQAHDAGVILPDPRGEIGFALRGVEIFRAQILDQRIVESIRHEGLAGPLSMIDLI